ncbi:MAG: PrsW family glutamic-type intramembrane protease [Bacteroidota bacterium]
MNRLAFISYVDLAVSVLPVFVFLACLVFLDSYKLVKFRSIFLTILLGSLAGGACYFLNNWAIELLRLDAAVYRRYASPIIEEFIKGMYIVYLIRSKRVGFMVDAAIYGFATGAGFALVENIFYVQSFPALGIVVWIIRGFGTAIMHGGATAIVGIISKNVSDRTSTENLQAFLPGLLIAIALHSFYNHFFFSPFVSTLLILILLPIIMHLVFQQSENSLRHWLRVGFDTDQELLRMITSGNLSQTPVGTYLQSLQSTFRPEVVVDMVCYLRLHVELTIQAKGILLMRQAGFEVPSDPSVGEKFAELRALAKNIGQTGKLAILPFLHTSGRELWQMHMLRQP